MASRSPQERLDELDAVFSALAHRARRQILLALRFRGGMSAGDIARRFEHAWPTTTRHLRVLEEAELITQERQGRARIYRVNTSKLGVIEEWLGWLDPPPDDAAPDGADDVQAPAEAALREFALSYPEAREDFPWGERVIKVNKKVFASFGPDDAGFTLTTRLPQSGPFALTLPFVSPTGNGLARHGWVTARVDRDSEPPLDLLRGWIDESYRAIAPRRLVDRLVRASRSETPPRSRSK